MLIGLMGRAGAGKDEVARVLAQEYWYARIAYADALKRALLHVNPLVGDEHLAALVRVHGFDFVKRTRPEVRRLLQEMGGAMRGVDPDIWTRPVERYIATGPSRIVVTDVRYPNEAAQIRALGGVLWRVERPEAGLQGSLADHESETLLRDYPADRTILNDGTLADLKGAVVAAHDGAARQHP